MKKFKIENGVLKKYNGSSPRVTVPEGVIAIEGGAFSWNNAIREVCIPFGVTRIGKGAFEWCRNLERVSIPNGVTRIEDNCFAWCESLVCVDIPDTLAYIGERAFMRCRSLTDIRIPPSVKIIRGAAFFGCESLREVVIPALTDISYATFFSCSSLTEAVIPDGVQTLQSAAFKDCPGLKRVVIPDSVKSLGTECFNGFSADGVIYCSFDLMEFLEDFGDSCQWGAVRGFIARWSCSQSSEEENGLWRGYIAKRTVSAFKHLADEPLFYSYVTENKIINRKRVTALLESTQNAECRAILLEYGNGRGRTAKSVDETVDDVFGLE